MPEVAEKNIKLKALRAERKLAGLCTVCGAPVEPGYLMCSGHVAKQREYQLRFRQNNPNYANDYAKSRRVKMKVAGKCSCGRETVDGLTRCAKCHATHLSLSVNRKARLILEGKCRCGREKDPAHYSCPTCLTLGVQSSKRSKIKRVAERRCRNCGRPFMMGETTKTCKVCIEKGDLNFKWN